jgi:hypothetical protein
MGNVFMVSHARVKRSSWSFQTGTNQLRETTLTENTGPTGLLCVGLTTPWKKNVTKTEEATVGRTILNVAKNGKTG